MSTEIPSIYESVTDKIYHWLANVATDHYRFQLQILGDTPKVMLTRSIHVFPDKTWCYMATDEQGRTIRGHITYPAEVKPGEVWRQMPNEAWSDLVQE